MVIPAVGIVIVDEHRSRFPVPRLLQEIQDLGYECLLVERIGIAGVRILVARSLQEADRGHVAGVDRSIEVGNVVLVVGLIAVHTGRPGVLQVLGGGVVLEGLVVGNVVGLVGEGHGRGMGTRATRSAVAVHLG